MALTFILFCLCQNKCTSNTTAAQQGIGEPEPQQLDRTVGQPTTYYPWHQCLDPQRLNEYVQEQSENVQDRAVDEMLANARKELHYRYLSVYIASLTDREVLQHFQQELSTASDTLRSIQQQLDLSSRNSRAQRLRRWFENAIRFADFESRHNGQERIQNLHLAPERLSGYVQNGNFQEVVDNILQQTQETIARLINRAENQSDEEIMENSLPIVIYVGRALTAIQQNVNLQAQNPRAERLREWVETMSTWLENVRSSSMTNLLNNQPLFLQCFQTFEEAQNVRRAAQNFLQRLTETPA